MEFLSKKKQETSSVGDSQKTMKTSWREIVKWVGDLPPWPPVARKTIDVLDNPHIATGELTDVVSADPALAARVLRIANSAVYGRQGEIATIDQAVMVLGLRSLKGILLNATLRHSNREADFKEMLIWENSIVTALACRETARVLRRSSMVEEAFSLGLLHDLGKFILVQQIPDTYEEVFELSRKGKTFVEAEKKLLSYAHQLIGAMALGKWGFSKGFCQSVLSHHQQLTSAPKRPEEFKRGIICFADSLAHNLGYGHQEGYPCTEETLAETAKMLRLDQDNLNTISNRVKNSFAKLKQTLEPYSD